MVILLSNSRFVLPSSVSHQSNRNGDFRLWLGGQNESFAARGNDERELNAVPIFTCLSYADQGDK